MRCRYRERACKRAYTIQAAFFAPVWRRVRAPAPTSDRPSTGRRRRRCCPLLPTLVLHASRRVVSRCPPLRRPRRAERRRRDVERRLAGRFAPRGFSSAYAAHRHAAPRRPFSRFGDGQHECAISPATAIIRFVAGPTPHRLYPHSHFFLSLSRSRSPSLFLSCTYSIFSSRLPL